MSTVGDVVSRVLRDFLASADDSPTRTRLTGAVSDSATSWIYDASMLSVDEEDALVEGVVVECGLEQVLIRGVDEDTSTLTVVRGFNGTTAALHAEGAVVTVAPMYSRRTVFDAVCDAVVRLSPTLFRVASASVSAALPYADVSADALSVVSVRTLDGESYYTVPHALLFDVDGSATGKALHADVAAGTTLEVTYRARFTRPTSESTDLVATTGLRSEWEQAVVYDAAGHCLLGSPEVNQASHNWLSEEVSAQSYPPLTAGRVGQLLIAEAERLTQRFARDLRSERRPSIVRNPTSRWVAR